MTNQFTPFPPPAGDQPTEPGDVQQPLGGVTPGPPAAPTQQQWQTPAVAQDSRITQAPAAWWRLLRASFTGDPARFTESAVGSTAGGGASLAWLFAAIINGAIVGLSLALLMAKLSSELGYFFAPDSGDYVAAFIIPIVCSVALLVARAGSIMWLFSVRKGAIAFRDACALASIAFVIATPFLAVLLVLSLIPGTFALVVIALTGVFTAFYAEIAVYVALARVGRFTVSPALPHAALSAAWLCVMSFIAAMIIRDVATNAMDALGVFL